MSVSQGTAFPAYHTFADQATVDERADFITKTYLHLAGAVVAFIAVCGVILNTPALLNPLLALLGMHQLAWLIFMFGFMAVSYVANSWARSSTSVGMQYAGLGLYVVAEAVIFAPLLYIASQFGDNVIPTAAVLTLITFAGLTITVFATRKNFSFLAPGLGIAMFAGIGIVICAALFHFPLPTILVSSVFIVISCGYILYFTSNVMHEYRIGQHVAASLALFASVALLFWYMIQLVMSLQSRD